MTGAGGETQPGGPRGPGFTLDLARCVGCGACVLACRMENQLPSRVSWRRVLQVNQPRLLGAPTYHLSVACHHCENPPCAKACPSGALKKGPDGLVMLEADRCIGCRYCEMACPFGAPSFDAEAGVMTKCTFCHHRVADGTGPACVAACPTGALGCILPESQEGLPEHYAPGSGAPGFGDPAGAEPGFWVADPRSGIRSEWYQGIKARLDDGGDGP